MISEDNDSEYAPKSIIRKRMIFSLAVALSCTFLYFNVQPLIPSNYISAIHFAGYGILCLLMFPLFNKKHTPALLRSTGVVIDSFLVLCLMVAVVYLIVSEDSIANRNYNLVTVDYIVASIAIAIALELIRRTMGWIIPCIILAGVSYILLWGEYVSGVFHFPGISFEYFFNNNFYGDNEDGLFGTLAGISWSMVFVFVLFGAFLVQHGTGDFIIRLAQSAVGRFTGGPGLVAVFGSGLMGSVSGSAIANTTATGVITIPMMKKAGFPAKFAAAVEAGASTGGQLIPPIMGAGVFIMINYTNIDYISIIKAAFLPGVLYFVSIAIYVRIKAKQCGLLPSPKSDESFIEILKGGWHYLLPLVVLVGLMVFFGLTPTFAGGLATLSVVVLSYMSRDRMKLPDILQALAQGSKNCATIAVLLITISLFVNSINTSGLSVTFSHMITAWADSNLLLMLLFVALASLVVGMGLPVTASYIVLATLCAPALYSLIGQHELVDIIMAGNVSESAQQIATMLSPELAAIFSTPVAELSPNTVVSVVQSVPREVRDLLLENSFDPYKLSMMLLSAHMIIFWLSQDSNVTPPVCLVAFAAASIAKTPPMATGFEAWKTAKALYVIPVLFAYTNFLGGSWFEIMYIFIATALGMYAFVAGLYGYLEYRQTAVARFLLLISGVVLVWPNLPIFYDLAALSLFIGLFVFDVKYNQSARAEFESANANVS